MPAMWKPGGDKPRAQGERQPKREPKGGDGAKIAGSALPARENAGPRPKFSLSQKTLAMKFMQRKKHTEADRKAALQERKKQDAWVEAEAPEDDSAVICVQDVADPSLPLVFGRRSFGGFNKGVEDEFKEVTRQLKYTESEEKAAREEVSAEEMASRMGKYTGLARGGNRGNSGSNQRKRQRK